jgi:uncharacterized membrane protein
VNYQNPYAPPQAAPPTTSSPGPFGLPLPWTVGEALSIAWNRFKENWAVLLSTSVLTMVVTQLVSSMPTILNVAGVFARGSAAWSVATYGFLALSCAISVFLEGGLHRIWIDAALGQSPSFEALFSQGARSLRYLAVTLLMGLAVVGGLLLLIVPAFIFGIGFCLAPYYVIDADMGPIRAMQASWAATRGQKGEIFVLGLANLGLMLVSLLACCVGVFAAIPICSVAMAVVYVRLSGRAAAAQPPAAEVYPPPGYGGLPGYGQPPGYGPPPGYG